MKYKVGGLLVYSGRGEMPERAGWVVEIAAVSDDAYTLRFAKDKVEITVSRDLVETAEKGD